MVSDHSRRSFVVTTGSLSVLATAGCLGGDEDGADEIEFWSQENQEYRQETINGLVQRFEEQGGISVETVYIDEDDMSEQVTAAQAAGDMPQAIQGRSELLHQLDNEGLIATDGVQNVIDSVGNDEFQQGALDLLSSPDGGYHGVPLTAWPQGFYYRESAFEEHGLDEPRTWDDILEAAETLHDPDNDQFGIGIGTETSSYTEECFTGFALSNDARVFNADGEVVFDSEEMVEAVEFYAELEQYTPPGRNDHDDARRTYQNEDCHLIAWSSFILDDIEEAGGEEMVNDTGFVPAVENVRSSTYGRVTGIAPLDTATDEQINGSADMIEFLLEDEQYIEWLHLSPNGMLPVLDRVTDNPDYQDHETLELWDETLDDIVAALDQVEQFGFVDGQVIPEWGDIAGELLVPETLVRVFDGDDPETAVEEQAERMRDAI